MQVKNKAKLRIAALVVDNVFTFFQMAAFLSLVFYFTGTKQDFSETTQFILLQIIFAVSVLVFLLAFFSILINFGLSVINKELVHIKKIIVYGVSGSIAIIFMIFSGTIIILSKGNII